MILTNLNYHSLEANRYYMSNSQYKDFLDCEAMAMAKITGALITPPNDACLLGSYVHAWVEGTLDEFKDQNPALFKQNGELYAKYESAHAMIATLRNDPFIQFVLQGRKEVIITAEMFGTPWKIKLDVYNTERGRFADLKTVANITAKHWDKRQGAYVSFVEAFGYIRQMALYAEIERIATSRRERLEPLIIAISKEDIPDKEVIGMDDDRLQLELMEVEARMERILMVKAGHEQPERCEHCTYCRRTKQLRTITHYSDLVV